MPCSKLPVDRDRGQQPGLCRMGDRPGLGAALLSFGGLAVGGRDLRETGASPRTTSVA